MAGGSGSANYGSWQNWLVAFFTLAVVTGLNHFAKGILKLASILIGIIAGYAFSACFGLVDVSGVASAGYFSIPKVLHFGIEFEPSACVAIAILFVINSIQAIGDFTATTTGSMDREPTDKEVQGSIIMYGISNILGAFVSGLPTATYSQNVGIITTTKVINRWVLGLAAALGVGVTQASASLSGFPEWVTTIFGKSPVVLATVVAIILNLILPKEKETEK